MDQEQERRERWERTKRAVGDWAGGVADRAKTAGNYLANPREIVNALRAPWPEKLMDQGEAIDMAMNMLTPMAKLATVYHGSPHKFAPTPKNALGEFDLAKIGSGEGGAAYGHGIYVAENPKVAKGYARMEDRYKRKTGAFTPHQEFIQDMLDKGASDLDIVEKAASRYGDSLSFDTLMADLRKMKLNQGHLYTADLADEAIPKMLDWDKPLVQQSSFVQKAITGLPDENAINMLSKSHVWPQVTGVDVYKYLPQGYGLPFVASQILKKAGVPGIRYLDQGSRLTGEGTSNYVVFDPDLLRIIARE